jgi:hypothetical protein
MSGAASDPERDSAAFVERDDRETELGYGSGGVPFYVALAWVGIIVAYLVAVVWLILPDFFTWQALP